MDIYPSDDKAWEQVWHESSDEFLMESAKAHLRQCLQSPQPGFGRLAQIWREAYRRGRPGILLRAIESMAAIRTASGEDISELLRTLDGLTSLLSLAGQEIVRLSGRSEGALLEMMRERVREAEMVAAKFRPQSGR
jgi:hypothetical protein